MSDLCLLLESLDLHREVTVTVTLDGVYNHIPEWRVRQLDRIARFYPYGYTTTPFDSE